MSTNKASLHKGKNGYAKHNEHEFLDEKNRDVVVWCFTEYNDSLEQSELDFYEKRYSSSLIRQNEKHIERRQYKRVKTIEDVYKNKNKKPTEEILQYGNIKTPSNELPSKDDFKDLMREYLDTLMKWSEANGNHLHILNASLHFDEATPHAQVRYIWDCKDENGDFIISQEEAMKQAGIKLPNEGDKVGRYNNRNITFTSMCRDLWYSILEDKGYKVDKVPDPNNKRKHKTIEKYKYDKELETIAELDKKDKEIEKLQFELSKMSQKAEDLEKTLLEAEEHAFALESDLERSEAYNGIEKRLGSSDLETEYNNDLER